jgi:hypothetical protein
LAAWIKPSALYDTEHRIISNGGYGNTNGAVDFVIATNGKLVVLNQGGAGQDECWSQSDSLFAVGAWSFVTATYNATTGDVKLYVNGAEVSTTINTLRVPNSNPSYNMHIGVMGGPLTMYFQGSIDEVRVYNRALTSAEISQIINVEATPTPTSSPTLTVSLSESASALYYGNTVNFTVLADGGTKPYTFGWYIDGQIAQTSASQYFSTNSQAVGSHHVYVKVTDADNNSATTLTVEFNVLSVSSSSPGLSPTPSPSIPEFPTFVAVPILMAVVLAGLIIFKRKCTRLGQ